MDSSLSSSALPITDTIARRARQLWDERGRPIGCDVEIWLEAERQVIAENTVTATAASTVPRSTPSVRVKAGTRSRKVAADAINPEEVQERLDDFGDPGRRSPTSATVK